MTPARAWRKTLAEAIALASPRARSAGPGTIDRAPDTTQILSLFIVASLPAALLGAWNAGAGHLVAGGAAADSAPAAFAAGLALWLPLLIGAALTALAWEVLFAGLRQRPADPGWAMSAWLYVLLLPPQTPLVFAVLGMSFGAVFGHHVFGGTGRYVASPAVIGALFLHFAYPSLSQADSTFGSLIALGATATVEHVGWWSAFAGREPGLLGTPSALAALAGALYLVIRGVVSLRTLGGGLLGLLLASLGGGLPVHWHFVLGNVAFCWAFVLTDPTTQPLTKSGRWLYGAAFGALVILMREADPAHPDGSLFAVLLAALLVPVIDYATLRVQIRRDGPGLRVDG